MTGRSRLFCCQKRQMHQFGFAIAAAAAAFDNNDIVIKLCHGSLTKFLTGSSNRLEN